MWVRFFKKVGKRIKRSLKEEFHKIYNTYVLLSLRIKFRPKLLSEIQTMHHLETHGCSMARFGDGEFNQLLSQDSCCSYQAFDPVLAEALEEVISSKDRNLLVCIPHALLYTRGYNKNAKQFWNRWTVENGESLFGQITKLTGPHCCFGDTQVTRPYIDWKSRRMAEKLFPLFKKLWSGRDVLLVEGCQTRFGVGNDLLADARSVKRILCPSVGAFSVRQEILSVICSIYSGELVLLALGPTATVLAADLSSLGIQALDIGHLDIEYEWFLRGVTKKCAIPGKYVNEVPEGRDLESVCTDNAYQGHIVARVGLE